MKKEQNTALAGVINEKMNRQLKQYLDICARCAICRDACHQYVATQDVRYLPAYRAELIRRIYKKYFTRTGRFVPALYEGRDPDENLLEELYNVMYACTGCRRCTFYCPFSIDTTWIQGVGKAMLVAAGKGSEILTQLADAAISKGENIEMFKDIVRSVVRESEPQLKERTGDPNAEFPYDNEGADILYVALAGIHSILPAAIIFHEAGEDYTISDYEGSNYGYFLGDAAKGKAIAQRIVDEAKRLKVKEVVITECGHAHRVLKFFYEGWAKEKLPFKVTSILDKIDTYIKDGRIKVDAKAVPDAVTYHDPCQIGRNFGLFEEPRDVVKAVCPDFREMTPNREKNWCCGGGGGLVAEPEFEEFRIKTGELKVDQIKATGAKVVVSPCENCRLQLETLNERYQMSVEITSIMDLVVKAMRK